MDHFSETQEALDRTDTDWQFGSLSLLSLVTFPSKEAIILNLPNGEVQRGREDTLDCATRAPINKLAGDFTYAIQKHIISQKNIDWLSQKGYLDRDGRFDASDAFIAILSGTTRTGNSMKAPNQAIRDYGLIPKWMLPLEPWMTWDDYHNKARITQEMLDLGKAFSKRFDINYERVPLERLEEVNEMEPVIVAGHAWDKPINGVYPRSEDKKQHVWLNLYPKWLAFDNYLDQGRKDDYIKTLAPDFAFYKYGYRVFISNEDPNVDDRRWSITYLMGLVEKLKALLAKLKKNTIMPLEIKTPRQQLLEVALAGRTFDVSPLDEAPDDVGCCDSVCELVGKVFSDFKKRLGTADLKHAFDLDKRFRQTDKLEAGNIIISCTGQGNGTIRGHVGILKDGEVIMSNNSRDGLWMENFTVASWVKRYRNMGGMKVYVYELV